MLLDTLPIKIQILDNLDKINYLNCNFENDEESGKFFSINNINYYNDYNKLYCQESHLKLFFNHELEEGNNINQNSENNIFEPIYNFNHIDKKEDPENTNKIKFITKKESLENNNTYNKKIVFIEKMHILSILNPYLQDLLKIRLIGSKTFVFQISIKIIFQIYHINIREIQRKKTTSIFYLLK